MHSLPNFSSAPTRSASFVVIAALLLHVNIGAGRAQKLNVDPPRLAGEIGSTAVFTCKDAKGVVPPQDIVWNYPAHNGGANFTSRASSENGRLTIRLLAMADAGEYACAAATNGSTSTPAANRPVTAVLIVYEMPDYLDYAVIIGVTAAVLLLVVVVGQAVLLRREKVKLNQEDVPHSGGGSDRDGLSSHAGKASKG